MSWEDRLLPKGAWTSPTGSRHEFDYEDVSRKTGLRRAAFDFIGVDGTYVQPNGVSGREFPLRCFFTGAECDTEADAFEAALAEAGTGRLEHPLYGTFDAVATGDIGRVDRLVREANQSVVEVTFIRPITDLYPSPQTDDVGVLRAARTSVEAAVSLEFAETAPLNTVAAREGAGVALAKNVAAIETALAPGLSGTPEALAALRDAVDFATRSTEALVSAPEALAGALFGPVTAATSGVIAASAQLAGLYGLVATMIAAPASSPGSYAGESGDIPTGLRNAAATGFTQARVVVMSALTSSAVVAADAEYASRPAAVTAAADLLTAWDAFVEWSEAGYAALGAVDTGRGAQELRAAIVRATGLLIRESFELALERRIVLTRTGTMLDLVAELYGSVDDQIDRFIADNDLSGAEILEMPAGREVVYYA